MVPTPQVQSCKWVLFSSHGGVGFFFSPHAQDAKITTEIQKVIQRLSQRRNKTTAHCTTCSSLLISSLILVEHILQQLPWKGIQRVCVCKVLKIHMSEKCLHSIILLEWWSQNSGPRVNFPWKLERITPCSFWCGFWSSVCGSFSLCWLLVTSLYLWSFESSWCCPLEHLLLWCSVSNYHCAQCYRDSMQKLFHF